MRNDPQNPGNNPKQQTQGRQEPERDSGKQSVQPQDKDKGKKGKTSPSRDDGRNSGRTH